MVKEVSKPKRHGRPRRPSSPAAAVPVQPIPQAISSPAMGIDAQTELRGAESPGFGELFPLDQLPSRKWMPKKKGKRISYFTVLRWALHGRSGIKLRTTMVGRLRCTTDRWAEEFFERLANPQGESKMPSPRDHERAVAELAAAGI